MDQSKAHPWPSDVHCQSVHEAETQTRWTRCQCKSCSETEAAEIVNLTFFLCQTSPSAGNPNSSGSCCVYLVLLPLDGALQLLQLALQLTDDVRLGLDLVELGLRLALQQGALHLRLQGFQHIQTRTASPWDGSFWASAHFHQLQAAPLVRTPGVAAPARWVGLWARRSWPEHGSSHLPGKSALNGPRCLSQTSPRAAQEGDGELSTIEIKPHVWKSSKSFSGILFDLTFIEGMIHWLHFSCWKKFIPALQATNTAEECEKGTAKSR